MEKSRLTIILPVLALSAGIGLAFGPHVLAQTVDPTTGLDTFAAAAGFTSQGDLTLIIARLIRTAIAFLGILAVVLVLYGGFLFMTAAGNDERVKKAKKVFTSAIIGLVIILSAFTIVQFVLSQLTSSLGGGVSSADDEGGTYADGGGSTSAKFQLSSVNTDCAEAMKNLELQFAFTKSVDEASVNAGGIVVRSNSGDPVVGTYDVSGSRVTFTPSDPCEEDEAERCFIGGADHSITLDDSILKSATGTSLTCNDEKPCYYEFTTGYGVDTSGPTLSMDAPEDGVSASSGDIVLLQTLATDDTGVSSVDFEVDGETVFQATLSDSTEGSLTKTNYFLTDGTQWDTAGFETGTHSVRAKGTDCAGHSDTASSIDVILRPAHCSNGTKDEDETGSDCGGEDCGSCDGTTCTSDADCADGYCDETSGECVGVPEIEEVSPGDGAKGNLVTISGNHFGTTPDAVTFLGDPTTTADDQTVSAYECKGSVRWSDNEIVVQLDSAMNDGPIRVDTADGYSDQTDDDYGPTISDFDVNGVIRPGLCMLDPEEDLGNSTVNITGNNFGSSQGTSTVYFTKYEASDYFSWADTAVSVEVPLLTAREYQTQVWIGDYQCAATDSSLSGTVCVDDADCATSDGETCATKQCSDTRIACAVDADCPEDGETCTSLRQGSNKLTFAVLDASDGETPVVSQVVSGWEACSSDDTHCGMDADCASGTCDAADRWGPPGQYVTIYGTSFGTSAGTVRFTDEAGYAIGDTVFPESCDDGIWTDTQITIKVPASYTNVDADGDGVGDPIEPGTFALTVKSKTAESDSIDFVILDDKPGPGLCSLDPSSGPAGTTVTALNGDNFGSDQGSGYVEYFDGNRVSETESWNDGRILAAVDESAKTGPVVVVTDDGYASNPLNFSVGDCREDASVCSSGTECCGDGTCGTSCGTERPVSHYAWTFSTGDIPATPRVAVFCGDRDDDGTYDGVSPGPWESWSAASEVCVNASVTATFTDTTGRAIVMESGSFDGNVLVQTCDNLDAKDPCANLDDRDDSNDGVVSGSVVATSADAFEWDPTDDFSPSTTYRVTLLSDGIRSADGAAMSADYSWEFTTATDTDPCEVGEVYVSPSTYTAVSKDEKVGYAASPIAEGDKCVPLQCDDYEWNWEVSDGSKAELAGDDLGRTDACENTVVALRETASGSPVDVEAGPEDVRGNPTDVGELTIDFTDPEVTSWTPSCDTACMNAGLRVEFSAEMDADDLVAGKTVTLYQCEDALCDNDKDEIEEFSGSYALSVSDDAQALSIAHDAFELGTWYRVVISGDVSSASGVALSESGSNWGTDANQSFSDDFSWTFKTKDSDVSCSIDRVEVSPSSASASVIGEQTAFEALAYGAPDDCSVSGQLLDATDYSWDAWTAEDSPNVSGTASDVAELIGDGSLLLSSALPDGCSSECLHTGADITSDEPVCGDGHVTYGEECDGGSRCSDECLNVGNPIACVGPITAGCCGNKIVDSGEECDDGNSSETDGCSSICLNNGSRRAGTTCGDGRVDQSATLGGEDCDDNDARSGDGCSSQCLFEGGATFTDAYATCGNGTIEDGEDCDDSNAKDGDGCSSKCLLEGAGACAFECVGGTDDGENCSGIGADCDGGICKAVHTPCCGDSVTDYDRDGRDDAEDCDEGDADNGDGCSSECLSEGSSVSFDEPSYCGDGDVGTGEECDVSSEAVFDIGNRSVSVIKATAQQDVLNGKAGAEITASSGGKTGTAELSLSCSCNSDASCGDESAYGCGAGSCCFARPELNDLYPAGGDDVCRNTSVYADFSELMDENSFDPSGDLSDPNLYLELISIGGEDADSSNCPADYVSLSFVGNRSGSWIARAWDWVVDSVRSWFGQGASAASYACFVPVTYTQTSSDSGSRVSLNLKDLLEPDATYRLVVVEDSDPSDAVDDGILSANLVGINGLGSGKESVTFTTSSNACELEKVGVSDLGISAALSDETLDPSVGYFTENGEVHALSAAAYTVRGGSEEEIGEIPGVYEWTWKWGSAVCDDASDSDCEENIVSVSDADSTSSTATAAGNSGRELAVATASFVPTNTFGETSGGVSGQVALVANVCDNPPSVGYPYTDSISNFSFFYCRDAGDASTTEDDLPELDAPVDVTSASTDIIQEVIFKVAGTADAIGVRVMRNESYLSPSAWYEEQGFDGSPSSDELDGYEAVRDGNTLYVAAANHVQVGTANRIYPNIYVISYTANAEESSQEIFDQILSHWIFNANDDTVTDTNVCMVGGAYAADATTGELVSCDWDADCVSLGSGAVCDGQKAKLTRDMRRLTNLSSMATLVGQYADENGRCEVTAGQSCSADADCPGTESCVPTVPSLDSGTFVRSYAVSAWPSWSAELGNVLGSALPQDPIDAFYGCDSDGYESATCWNATSATFECPDESHVYAYQSLGGTSYRLYAQLEYDAARWAYDMDAPGTLGEVVAEYDYGGSGVLPVGFSRTELLCKDGSTYGVSAVCGDGVVGSGERCEIGGTDSIDCTYDSNGDGTDDKDGSMTTVCRNDCSGYLTEVEAEGETYGAVCVPYSCGNGVVERANGEACDDGSLNGTYGHCGDDCTLETAFSCGDGYLAGTEQCDCGEVSNYSDVMSDAASWASINDCKTSNGQWKRLAAGTCSWDCTYPGPSCGDGEVNGSEECDGGSETWTGALCADGSACSSDSDCDDGSVCGNGGAVCGTGATCIGGTDDGLKCDDASLADKDGTDEGTDCDSGACSDAAYALTRTRTCATSSAAECTWNTWTSCVSAAQYCGNGTVEGTEACDDGNNDETDACTGGCVENACGDGNVYVGVESCDSGSKNGIECTPTYGGTCNYCTSSCTYKTKSGSYCGDGIINGSEYCDGSSVSGLCIDTSSGVPDRSGSCTAINIGTTSGCDSGYTCRSVGICNGGDDNGTFCTLDATAGTDTFVCGTGGECVPPTCSDDCSSTCPDQYVTASILAQTEEIGATAEEGVSLYDYQSEYSPDNAVLYLPACSVATGLQADVDTSGTIAPTVAVVFATDLSNSMGWSVDASDYDETAPDRRIDYVVDALRDGIEALYDSDVADMRIGAVGFSGALDNTTSEYDFNVDSPGYYIDYDPVGESYLLSKTYESDLVAAVENYKLDPGNTDTDYSDYANARPPRYLLQWTPTYKGVEAAVKMLETSDADVKVLVLLSDGNLTHDKDWTYCETADELSSCVQQIRKELITPNSDIRFYSAAITNSSVEAGYIAHMSSDTCGSSYSSVSDCEGSYFHQAATADEISGMYEDVVSSVLDLTFSLTTEASGVVETTIGSVKDGRDQTLPFPEDFACTGSDMTVPFTVDFNGGGTVTLNNFNFTYCPAP